MRLLKFENLGTYAFLSSVNLIAIYIYKDVPAAVTALCLKKAYLTTLLNTILNQETSIQPTAFV